MGINNLFFLVISILLILYVVFKVKKNHLSLKESMFWVAGAIVTLILSFSTPVLDKVSAFLNIKYPPSLLFLIAIIFSFLLLFRQSQQISKMNEKLKELTEYVALIDERVRKR